MKKAILIQARLSSSRFPGKMLEKLGGVPLVEFVYKRCLASTLADAVAVITSDDESDDRLADYCAGRRIGLYRGSLENVLDRYVNAAEHYGAGIVARVCGDSPFVDVGLMDGMLDLVGKEGLDYSAPDKRSCVAGLDSEAVTLAALKRSLDASMSGDELEHVTLHIRNNPGSFKVKYIKADLMPRDLENVSMTVDYPEDMALCDKVLGSIGIGYRFRSEDVFKALRKWRRADVRYSKVP